MSEYTFETAALKAVTIDAVKYNEEGLRNSITPETIQAIAPIAWKSYIKATANGYGIAFGSNAKQMGDGVSFGVASSCGNPASVAIGCYASTKDSCSITIGGRFKETIGAEEVLHQSHTQGTGSITIGAGANTLNNGDIESSNSVTIGCKANTTAPDSITLGAGASNTNFGSILIGSAAKSEGDKALTITIGSQFTETTDAGDITHSCSTEGTGSITIGAGANTLNNGDTESSNSVTIGCKASNSGANSVVIGAQASGKNAAVTCVGASSSAGIYGVSLGKGAQGGNRGVSVGDGSYSYDYGVAIGYRATTVAGKSQQIAIGANAKVSDYGATVIRSTAEDGTITQLYFSGANTPLANDYEDGEAMMGYIVCDSAGNIMMDAEGNALVGTQKLSVLFPNNRGENAFAPTVLDLDEEYTPKPMFHPSDLDLPQEESEVEEPENIEPSNPLVYKPQPIYPIVEPEIEEINE